MDKPNQIHSENKNLLNKKSLNKLDIEIEDQ